MKTSRPIRTLLGRFSSKKEIVYPLDLSPNSLENFVNVFSDLEKIELFCLAEFLVYTRVTNQEKTMDMASLTNLESYLKRIMDEPRMAALLESNGLRTSIDRLNLGRSLALSKN